MAKGKNQHVVPYSDGWAVKGAGNSYGNDSYSPRDNK